VQVDPVAQVKVVLAARRHDAVESVHGVEVLGEDDAGLLIEVGLAACCVLAVCRSWWNCRLDNVRQVDLMPVVEELLGEGLADEAPGPRDENLHDGLALLDALNARPSRMKSRDFTVCYLV